MILRPQRSTLSDSRSPDTTLFRSIAGASGASGPDIVAAFTALDGLNDLGTINDRYYQNGTNWALFTHNIVHITDTLDLTLGLRYTHDKKKFSADFTNANTVCTTIQSLVLDDLTSPTSNATAKALTGRSDEHTSELQSLMPIP